MNIQSQTNPLLHSSLALALVLSLLTPVTSRSADPVVVPAEDTANEGRMMEQCEKMMEHKKKMRADLQAQNAELTEHAARMNSATADKKVEEMAALITHMLKQRIAMDERRATMEAEMMDHMSEHMGMGKESMSKCPMMKGAGHTATDDHKEHPEKAN